MEVMKALVHQGADPHAINVVSERVRTHLHDSQFQVHDSQSQL